MEQEKVEETGIERLNRLRKEAKEYGITGTLTADAFEVAIAKAKADGITPDALKSPEPGGLTPKEAKSIEARLKYEFEYQEKLRAERKRETDRTDIIAESESLNIPIVLPDNPTELQLAKARRLLGIKKKEIRPSPETVAIEASKRGYYVYTNREQEDAAHTVNLGGKYSIHLIPEQIHVLSEYHVKKWKQIAVTPIYGRVATGVVPSDATASQFSEKCERTGGKPRFTFEYLGEAPQDAPFGMVTDTEILAELKQEELV